MKKFIHNYRITAFILLTFFFLCTAASAQTTAFNFQGRLNDGANPANGNFELQFKLFDATAGGNQIGGTVTQPGVAVINGIFSAPLDFGAAPFDGGARFVEIGVRPAGSLNPFTILNPRQQIGSVPYSVKSINSAAADSLSPACVGCVQDVNIVAVSGTKITGEIPTQSVPTGSDNYIQNAAAAGAHGNVAPQQEAGFNINGNGEIGGSLGLGIAPRGGVKLDVMGTAIITPAGSGSMQLGNPNSETGMTTLVGGGRADMRFDGTTLKLVAGLVGGPPPSTNGIVVNNAGKVGIGVVNPVNNAKLQVDGGSNMGLEVNTNTSSASGLFAIDAINSGSGIAVYGSGGTGVSGNGSGTGVHGSGGGYGIFGISTGGASSVATGVYGEGTKFGVFSKGFLGVDRLGAGGNTTLCINLSNQIANCSSSLRYKTNFQPFSGGLDLINQLSPIAFRWKADNQADIGFGAEDVARINPLFVTYNAKGEVEGVKYDRLSVVFVNAFKDQQAQIEAQRREIEGLKDLICIDHPQAKVCQ